MWTNPRPNVRRDRQVGDQVRITRTNGEQGPGVAPDSHTADGEPHSSIEGVKVAARLPIARVPCDGRPLRMLI